MCTVVLGGFVWLGCVCCGGYVFEVMCGVWSGSEVGCFHECSAIGECRVVRCGRQLAAIGK